MKHVAQLIISKTGLQPGQEWMEGAGAWRVLAVFNGAAYWLGEGSNNRPLSEGELLVAGPAATGTVRVSLLSPVHIRSFMFLPESIRGFLTLEESNFLKESIESQLDQVRVLPATHPAAERFAQLAVREDREPGTLMSRIEALSVVALVFWEHMPQRSGNSPQIPSPLHKFKQLISQMPESEMLNHTPTELAEMCGCSVRHFNRLFRRRFGASARDVAAELRSLSEARENKPGTPQPPPRGSVAEP